MKIPYTERKNIILDILSNYVSRISANENCPAFWQYQKATNCSVATFREDLLKMWRENLICRIKTSGGANHSRKFLGGATYGTYKYIYVLRTHHSVKHYQEHDKNYGRYIK
ncbi:hypothetical protein [Campylobacter sp. RM16188]|uniref:hypothetical protein n=1 Tax=Campylobacter sp. RM16188 TaxID=1705725 RepID=UPI001553268A|nr:hypothetical protein [Campylobacter sp. RM16188]